MSTPPPTYENYPPTWGDNAQSGDGSATQPQFGGGLATPPPPPPPSGSDRRGVLRLAGTVAAGLVGLTVMANVTRSSSSSPPAGDPGDAGGYEGGDPDDEAEVGDYTVTWPGGWTKDVSTDTQLVLTQSGATVIFRSYTAGDDATVEGEAKRLLKRHASGIGKQKTTSTSTPDKDADVEIAGIEVTGVRSDGDKMDASAYVALNEDGEALAVIALLPAKASEKLRRQLRSMRREFLDQLL